MPKMKIRPLKVPILNSINLGIVRFLNLIFYIHWKEMYIFVPKRFNISFNAHLLSNV